MLFWAQWNCIQFVAIGNLIEKNCPRSEWKCVMFQVLMRTVSQDSPSFQPYFCETNLSGSLIDILMLFECGLDFADIQYSLSRIRTFDCAVSLTPQSKTTSIWFYFLYFLYSTFLPEYLFKNYYRDHDK